MMHKYLFNLLAIFGMACSILLCQCSSGTTASDTLDLCTVDEDCPYGQYCDDGICVTGNTACDADNPCPDGMECRNGTCITSGVDGGSDGDGGLDADGGNGDITQTGPAIVIISPPATGSPPVHQLNFGNVAVGVSAEQQIVLENIGDEDLRIIELNFESGGSVDDFSIPQSILDSLPLTVAPNQQATLDVVYTASDGVTDHGVLDIISNDPVNALVKVQLLSEFKGEAKISASPAALVFGDIPVGDSSQPLTATLSNQGTGNAVLTINDIRFGILANPDFELVIIDANQQAVSLPVLLNNGDFVDVLVTYHPQANEDDSDELVAVSDDPITPSLAVPLSGSGVIGDVSAQPSPIALGRVRVLSHAEQTVTISNSGGATLELTGIALVDTSAEWLLSSSDVDLADLANNPHVLNAQESVDVLIGFDPADIGLEEGKLVIDHSGPGEQLEVALSASSGMPLHRLRQVRSRSQSATWAANRSR
ncbi:MAG: choice-of-anchor D domain-containing protein [Deltaproteobacteria bacterium]|nr:choice-of-anchor D domain-containing protein [Deltaproteobacteria bacterium]